MSRAAAALAAALLGSVLVSGCGTDEASGDAVLEAQDAEVDGTATDFVVPTGALTVTVGDPVSEVGDGDLADGDALAAPDGSSLLPVGVDFSYPDGAPWGTRLAASPQEADVTVTVDGQTRDLGSPYPANGQSLSGSASQGYYVVVPGEPGADDITLEVTYDGAGQTATVGAEPSGPAAGLAALPADAPGGADCPTSWSPSSAGLEVECSISLVGRTPYWPGAGWAPDEGQWVVIGFERLQVYPAGDSGLEVTAVEGSGVTEDLDRAGSGTDGLSGVLVVDSSTLTGGTVPLELSVDTQTASGESRSQTLSYDLPVGD